MINAALIDSQEIPLVIEPDGNNSAIALNDLANAHSEALREKLLLSGAILFRGFQITSLCEFESVVRAISGQNLMDYAGGVSPRFTLSKGVYTSTEYPQDLTLSLHNELSYAKNFPRYLFFCCLVEPASGGETTLGSSREILERIDPEIVELFRRKNVRYDRNLSGDPLDSYSWQRAFETDSRSEVEFKCREIDAKFVWDSDGSIKISQIGPATAIHPETGQEVWFNQAEGFHPSALDLSTYESIISTGGQFRLESFFGDGTTFSSEILENIRQAQLRSTIKHRWQKGDVLMLDNLLTAHGRMPFNGPRKIALAMA